MKTSKAVLYTTLTIPKKGIVTLRKTMAEEVSAKSSHIQYLQFVSWGGSPSQKRRLPPQVTANPSHTLQ